MGSINASQVYGSLADPEMFLVEIPIVWRLGGNFAWMWSLFRIYLELRLMYAARYGRLHQQLSEFSPILHIGIGIRDFKKGDFVKARAALVEACALAEYTSSQKTKLFYTIRAISMSWNPRCNTTAWHADSWYLLLCWYVMVFVFALWFCSVVCLHMWIWWKLPRSASRI